MPTTYERNQPLPSVGWSRSATLLVASCLALAAQAQTAWPSKPVKLVVAFPPGGVADVMARVVSQPLSEALGQPVIIENRAGANGNVAADTAAKAPADGYTLLVSTTGIESVNPFLFAKMPYDPGKDLAHVAALGRIQLFLVTKPSLPVKDTKEFVAFAKASPGKLSYGSAGAGSTPHLAGELFKQQAGFYATHIPYRGAAPALQDLLASQLDYYFDPGIRGRIARLDGVLDQVLKQHAYPSVIEALVAETALLTALIGQTIKLRWKLSLQIRSKGPARLIATDYYGPTEDGQPARIRAYASYDEDRLDPNADPFSQIGERLCVRRSPRRWLAPSGRSPTTTWAPRSTWGHRSRGCASRTSLAR